jgi:hypothetical protein
MFTWTLVRMSSSRQSTGIFPKYQKDLDVGGKTCQGLAVELRGHRRDGDVDLHLEERVSTCQQLPGDSRCQPGIMHRGKRSTWKGMRRGQTLK